MKAFMNIEPDLYEDLMGHLLPAGNRQEQAVFLFADSIRSDHQVTFEVVEARKLGPADFARQQGDYLEMADATRASLIKEAHDLEASLVEIHSHLGPWPAGFSYTDRLGLQETVPHMWWRLNKRPYLALVVTNSGFDALLWLDDAKIPRALDGLQVGERMLTPTNFSLGGWG
jgi:hypothetical protein